MKDINSGKELVNKVKNILKNYDFEIIVSGGKSELTRFAESYIHQNVAEADLNLTVKIINENRIGAVQMNSIDEATMSKNIKKAIEVTRITPKLDYNYKLLKPQSYKIKSKYSKDTANFTPLTKEGMRRREPLKQKNPPFWWLIQKEFLPLTGGLK